MLFVASNSEGENVWCFHLLVMASTVCLPGYKIGCYIADSTLFAAYLMFPTLYFGKTIFMQTLCWQLL